MIGAKTDEKNMFRPQALSRLKSVEDLDAYIRVTSPSGWVVLIASLFFLAGIIIWASTAEIPTTRTFTGLADNESVLAWVDSDTLQDIQSGNTTATIAGVRATIAWTDSAPVSKAEMLNILSSDYLTSAAVIYDWNYFVYFNLQGELKRSEMGLEQLIDLFPKVVESETAEDEGVKDAEGEDVDMRLVPVEITTSETRPLRLVFGKGDK